MFGRSTKLACLIAVALLTVPLLADEVENPGWLGVSVGQPGGGTPGAGAVDGIVVTGIVADSPAERAGLRAQDRILTLDGAPISSFTDFRSALQGLGPKSWVSMSVERSGETMDIDARLSGPPETQNGIRLRVGWIGIEAIDLTGKLREHFGAPAEAGVMIADVKPGSPAESAGLRIGDVVYDVNEKLVQSMGRLRSSVARGGVGNTLEMKLVRAGAEIVVEATIAVEPPKDQAKETS